MGNIIDSCAKHRRRPRIARTTAVKIRSLLSIVPCLFRPGGSLFAIDYSRPAFLYWRPGASRSRLGFVPRGVGQAEIAPETAHDQRPRSEAGRCPLTSVRHHGTVDLAAGA